MSGVPVAAPHRLGGEQRVQDRLFRCIDHRCVERSDLPVREHAERDFSLLLVQAAVAGGKGEEEVAARVRGRTTHASDAEADSLGQAVALMREERGVGRCDADDRACVSSGGRLRDSLADELSDGDAIYAVIKGSASNHDGKTQGYTVPNPVAQTEVIARAWERAGTRSRCLP